MFNPIDERPAQMLVQSLVDISDRLYCTWQCSTLGAADWIDHEAMIGRELSKIWEHLNDVIDSEKARLCHVAEEMKKFEQGFAYKRPLPDLQQIKGS